ncbi:immune inhibitor A domain-containing protein [Demequina silvatica]|uniref:immune inhibitor A domain-containing protein n=1 Tax=Demequina silvatica TaxID=1638988 RepID=UPI0007810050|nr:immune inhibitor A domain-containing protein [Demequina silvatica]
MPKSLLAATTAVALGATLVAAPAATAAPPIAAVPPADPAPSAAPPSDNMPNPLDEKRSALRETAITGVLEGELQPEQRGGSEVVKVGTEEAPTTDSRSARGGKSRPHTQDQYVELSREATDRIFVILAEFGDEPSPYAPAEDAQRTEGPLHNEIPEPDRTVDNSTVWQADYSQDHFQDLYFGEGESLRDYYETQSSGRYSVDGEVTDWVKVDATQGRYGTDQCGSNVCSTVWDLVRDAANVWYEDQLAQGRSVEEVNADLASFDEWDRYDFDGDGDFNEPDGYIDHFQIVHAGGDQADGDPIYGGDAIWSHRWYAYYTAAGRTGPEANPLGGTQIGDSGVWIGDYTMQPENGGRSVFYHEYGHDLGLPDDYNVQSGGDNNNEHWTLMAQSRLGAKEDDGIGERGGDLGAWNKLQLGWLDYELVDAGERAKVKLGPAEYNSRNPQALIVSLPEKTLTTDLGAPASGESQWYSGTGDDLTSTLTRSVTLPEGSPALTFQARYDIEEGYDYFYVEVDSGEGFVPIAGSTTHDIGGGIQATDGTQADWTEATFDLSAYAGQTVDVRIRYTTDGGVAGNDPDVVDGLFLDDIAIEGVFTDGAEEGDNGWTVDGFSVVGTTSTEDHPHYYIAANRSYVSYDRYLETGPYFFGYASTKPDWVDHYAYQEGLLISYWDTSFADNDTFAHPGGGRNLYIDAHPRPLRNVNGDLWRARVQVYDAPFGLERTDSVMLHVDGERSPIRGQRGNPVFDDTDQYWFAELPNHGVKLPAEGVEIRVVKQKGTSMTVRVS